MIFLNNSLKIMGDKTNIAIIGGGSWATAIVKILSEKENITIQWLLRSEEAVQHILQFKHNPNYLSDVEINLTKVTPTTNIQQAVDASEIIILVVPAAFLVNTLTPLQKGSLKNKILVSAIKGMVPNDNILFTEYLVKEYQVSNEKISVIAGPCHAEEVALEKQSFLTIGTEKKDTGILVANLLACRYVKTNIVMDIIGLEYASIIKNIVAVACGIAHGLNYGDNFQAVLVSNALREMRRFIKHVEQKERKYIQTAYLGDLLVTAYSQFSRNRTFGSMIGRGYSVKSAQFEMNMIAEGYYATKNIYEINKIKQIDMPVLNTVYHILYEKKSPKAEFMLLTNKLN